MKRKCMNGRRIGNIKKNRKEKQAWDVASNGKQSGVEWKLTINDARNKLKSLYPKTKG